MASFYWIHGAGTANWNTIGNWSATSGGASNGAIPTTTSDVFFDGAGTHGNDASTLSATITVLSFTVTSGYTNTITLTGLFTIVVAGNVTLGANFTIAGTGYLQIIANSTLTSNGKVWPNNLYLSGSFTYTLADNWTVNGVVIRTGTGVLNGNTLNCAGGLNNGGATSGTTILNITGGTFVSSVLITGMTLNFAGNVTVNPSTSIIGGGTIVNYVSGNIITTGSTLQLNSPCTFNTAGIKWNIIGINFGGTVTLNSLLLAATIFNSSNNESVTWAGTAGFITDIFSILNSPSALTTTFTHSLTYIITTEFLCYASRIGAVVTYTSDHATLKANLILQQGAVCNVLANFTRIDASGGRSIQSFNGTITSCVNVFAYTNVQELPIAESRMGRRAKLYNSQKSVRDSI